MDFLYKDRGLLINVAGGTIGGTVAGASSGAFSALYQFYPGRGAPEFNFPMIARYMSRHSFFLGAVGFAFTLGENLTRTVFEKQRGPATILGGCLGMGTVFAVALQAPFRAFQRTVPIALILCWFDAFDYELIHMHDDLRNKRQANNPFYEPR